MSFLCLNCSKISESLWDLDDEVEVFGSSMGGVAEEEEVENVMLLCKKEVGGGADFAKGLCFKFEVCLFLFIWYFTWWIRLLLFLLCYLFGISMGFSLIQKPGI